MNMRMLTPQPIHLENGFPLRVYPGQPGATLAAEFVALRNLVDQRLERDGAVLFSGFNSEGVEGFQRFAAAFGHPLLNYEFGSTPRSQVDGKGVYTSTEYPAHRSIPLHNEQAYTTEWPMRIWFYCAKAAVSGGETPIADSREVFRRIDPVLRKRFKEKRLMYVRNYGNGLDLTWQQVFNTEHRHDVENYCRKRGIQCEWNEDGDLRTRQRVQGVAQHPRTRDWVWFNQAHLFHLSNLDPEMQEILLDTVGEEGLPRNVYYGDGSPLEEDALAEIRGVLDACEVVFPWATGDVLMLDNMLTAHSRKPFSGERKVVVAMAEGVSGETLFNTP
ncbi:TauD/TfdA family dioxygenase [Pseudomonas sp. GD03842]|uniref:TauD/TfdA family dioxygenase n=1 Tax=Pseudomonas sp. GD03842 TaxID=2975385 RepID=UPI0024486A1E|nr:TauD/TfdA family dioxygenase [Pseudomonas sp. GD03842]MDH0749812.1 TauD/TfdA family dioxygenase [Pseudomonas sp. GD03842]